MTPGGVPAAQVLEPLCEFVARKLVQLKARELGIAAYDNLLKELRECRDKTRELEIIKDLEAWQPRIEELNTPLAFADKEDATQMINVAQYYDEWVHSKSGCLRAWYVCMAGMPKCGTVMPSKGWTRRYANIGASKQRWYCVCCGARYKTKFGMLVEIHSGGASTFFIAEVSNKDAEDVRAMRLEQELNPKNHKDLWDMIPNFQPMDPADILRPVKDHEFNSKEQKEAYDPSTVLKFLDADAAEKVPKWKWDSLFNLFK